MFYIKYERLNNETLTYFVESFDVDVCEFIKNKRFKYSVSYDLIFFTFNFISHIYHKNAI